MLPQCSSKLDVRCLTEDTREEPRQSKLDSLLEMASLLCVSRPHEPPVTLLVAHLHSGPCGSLFSCADTGNVASSSEKASVASNEKGKEKCGGRGVCGGGAS